MVASRIGTLSSSKPTGAVLGSCCMRGTGSARLAPSALDVQHQLQLRLTEKRAPAAYLPASLPLQLGTPVGRSGLWQTCLFASFD